MAAARVVFPAGANHMNTRRRPAIAGPRDRRRGFTLVELLIVIMIISILTGLTLVVLRSAQDDASEARTRTQIERIKGLIMERLETYQTRIIPFKLDPTTNTPDQWRDLRRTVLCELVRVELPFDPLAVDSTTFTASGISYPQPFPTLLNRFENYFSGKTEASTGNPWFNQFAHAELLYAVLSTIVDTDGRSALDYVRSSEIDDADQDECPEVLDGWGIPFEDFAIAWNYDPNLETYLPLDPNSPQQLDIYEVVLISENLKNR